MTLPDFYDRLLEAKPSLQEGPMRSRLTEALEIVSRRAGVPRVRLTFDSVAPTTNGAGEEVPPFIPVDFVVREILRPTAPAGEVVRLFTAGQIGASVADDLGGEPGVLDVVFAQGALAPFEVDVMGNPPEVPTDATSEEGAAWEVPWPDAVLNYILSELYAANEQTIGLQRLHFSRYERAVMQIKIQSRSEAMPDLPIQIVPDAAIWS